MSEGAPETEARPLSEIAAEEMRADIARREEAGEDTAATHAERVEIMADLGEYTRPKAAPADRDPRKKRGKEKEKVETDDADIRAANARVERELMGKYGITPEAMAKAKDEGIRIEQLIEAKRSPEGLAAMRALGIELAKTDAELIAEHGIPDDAVAAAERAGMTVEYMLALSQSPTGRERLREALKSDWPPEPEERETEEPPPTDPRLLLLQQGRAHLQATEALIKEIEEKPGKVRRSLKGMGKFPLLGRIPIVGKALNTLWKPVYIYGKSWLIYFKWRRERPDKIQFKNIDGKDDERDAVYNDGLLRIGGDYRRQARQYLIHLDKQIGLARSKLGPLNRHKLMTMESLRREEAERILRIRREVAGVWSNRIIPPGYYRHFGGDPKSDVFDPMADGRLGYKPAIGAYMEEMKNRPTLEPGKYDEFPAKKEHEPDHDIGSGAGDY